MRELRAASSEMEQQGARAAARDARRRISAAYAREARAAWDDADRTADSLLFELVSAGDFTPAGIASTKREAPLAMLMSRASRS